MRLDGNLDLFKDDKRTKNCTHKDENKRLSLILNLLKRQITVLNGVYKIRRNKVYGSNSTKTKGKWK